MQLSQVQEIDSRSNPDRPLPRERSLHEGFEYGFYESTTVKDGRVSLRQALEFINNHHKEPETHTAEAIAKQYKLDPQVTGTIVYLLKPILILKTII